ncbi:uncharacterized protein A4U43_C06F1610 [Asparagus officinalis]|uniref:Uncharacterized protein n=1 Tax=Asparagus officinalis TaxID=4686 RepID=A0A5P1EP90_ASPOF|nr:uncharacterized protein LOC109845513 [Asparagus officinalis]ONK65850.1 uncharacterized protein A4U43_C06F1610 [Asparagus officinalis]
MRALKLGFLLSSVFLLTTPTSSKSPTAAGGGEGGRGRSLLGFTETKGNASFQCSPSGPCLPCAYSEKNDEKYRCSETGYRVPLKCVEIEESSKEETDDKKQRRLYSNRGLEANAAVHKQLMKAVNNLKWRRLLDDSSASEGGKQSYITFRSCVPVDGEEKLSVLGFEMIMFGLLLISGPVVYMRKRHTTSVMPGAVRIPSNPPRF